MSKRREGVKETRRQSSRPMTYPQLTQAMVPWPFSVWATSDSSFRWESPDGAAERRLSHQDPGAPPPPRHTEDTGPGRGGRVTARQRKRSWVWDAGGRGGSSYISDNTIEWLGGGATGARGVAGGGATSKAVCTCSFLPNCEH